MLHGKVLRVEKDGFGIVDIEGADRFGFFSRERTTILGPAARVSVGDAVTVDVIDTGKDALVISTMAVASTRPPAWRRLLDGVLRTLPSARPRDNRRDVRAQSE